MKKRQLVLAILLVSLLSICASAEQIGVSTYVIGMDNYNIATGEYSVDLMITLDCDECILSDFEIINGRIDSSELNYQKPGEKQYRAYAHLTNVVDLEKYPFDNQEIILTLEHKQLTEDKIQLVPRKYGTGVDQRLEFPGWVVQKWTAEVASHHYPAFDRTYSTYTFSFELKREVMDSIIKIFFPMIFLIIIIMSTYILSTDKIELRIGIVSSIMIALVMLHIMMLSHLPPTSYLTFADKFMLLTYIVLLFSFVINVIILRLSQLQKKKIVEEIHRKTRYSMIIIIPILYVLFFWLFI
jgi:hypothetical protein